MAFDGRLYRTYSARWRRKGRAFYNFPGKKCLKYFKYSKFATDWMPAAKCTLHTFHGVSFQGKSWWKVRWLRGRAAQKIRFEFHTGDYGCRFRPWRFDSIRVHCATKSARFSRFRLMARNWRRSFSFFFFFLNIRSIIVSNYCGGLL